ncbi:hypothetical protein Hanom_Chr11g01048171 [Helianthus anomalus]
MELRSRMKTTRFHTFWIHMRKNKPLDESRKTSQTSGTKMTFYTLYHQTSFLHFAISSGNKCCVSGFIRCKNST